MSLRCPIQALPSRLGIIKPQHLTQNFLKQPRNQQQRTFLSPASLSSSLGLKPPLQKISASRTLPYPSAPIYNTIANVPSYSSFLPYCLSSEVTHWSNATSSGSKYPERAELEVGWGGVRERFASRIYCVPGRIVEAIAGSATTSLNGDEIKHHRHDINGSPEAPNGPDGVGEEMSSEILSHLSTRWNVEPVNGSQEQTRVSLDIEVQFVNPVYAAMSSVAAEKVAEKMIEAFERKIEEEMRTTSKQEKDSSS